MFKKIISTQVDHFVRESMSKQFSPTSPAY